MKIARTISSNFQWKGNFTEYWVTYRLVGRDGEAGSSLSFPETTIAQVTLYYQMDAQCPMHTEGKQHQNIWVWNREMFIARLRKEKGGLCQKKKKKPWTPLWVSAKHFYRQSEGGARLVVENFFLLDSVVLAAVYIVMRFL